MPTPYTTLDTVPWTQSIAGLNQSIFSTTWTANTGSDVLVYSRLPAADANDVTQLVASTDYTVQFIGSTSIVQVTFVVPPAQFNIITIIRDTPSTRADSNLYTNTNFVPSMLNGDFERLTLVDQQNDLMASQYAPHYNASATVVLQDSVSGVGQDEILPILGANQIWAKNNDNNAIIAYDVPDGGGLAPSDSQYLIRVADADLPNAQVMGVLASGIVVNTTTTGVQLTRTLTGTAEQLTVTNGNGIVGNPTVSITNNPIIGGTEGLGIPTGTTAQRPGTVSGTELRFNTTLNLLEYHDSTDWVQLSETDGIASIQGTTNQVLVNGTSGTPEEGIIILTLPQSIGAGSSPTFAGLTLGASALTLGGSLTTAGAFASTFTMTGATTVTFPTSGTLATLIPTVASIAGTANQIAASASTGAVTLSLASNPILPGTGGVTLPSGNTAARAGGAGTIRFNTQSAVFESTVDGVVWATIDTAASGDVDSIIGTADQINVSNPTGNVTLSLPQSIATTSSPTFAALTLTAPLAVLQGGTGATTSTGSGQVVLAASPTLITPDLGTPSAVVLTNATGYPFTAPTIQKFTSGSGTYTTPVGVLYINVKLVGGGGGGAGSGTASSGNGGTGGNSSFGTTLLLASGGLGGNATTRDGGAGGDASLGTGPVGTAIIGGSGGGAGAMPNINQARPAGGDGASSAFGGGGGGGGSTGAVGQNATANSGAGGGGGGISNVAGLINGAGGGAGGYIDAIITSPSASYAYAIGAAGSAGTAGTSGAVGGAGGSGYIIIVEYYQ